MLNQAIKELKIDPARSIMIGDKMEDMIAGKSAGIKTNVLVRSGKPISEDGEKLADHVIDSITDVVALIKKLK